MSNTLTSLMPDIYAARDIVSRELTGLITAVATDVSDQQAAKDETIRWAVTPSYTPAAITPASTVPALADTVIANKTITLDQYYHVPFHYTGEEQKGLMNGGQYRKTFVNQLTQAMRSIVNQVEGDLAGLYYNSSRAVGTAGTPPFGSDLSDINEALQILKDNGAPMEDLQLVINTTAGLNLRNLTQLTNVNQSGTDATLRRGELLNLSGFSIRESAQIVTHTKGTATGFDCTAVEPVGETTVATDGSNSGTVLAGDIVTRGVEGGSAADANKYVVYSGSTLTGNAAGNFIINGPGLKVATTVTDEWTIGSSYTANMAFSRNAFQLAMRPPAMPEGGDAANDVTTIADPNSGLVFLLASYGGYHARVYDVSLLWGVAAGKPEHACIVMG